MNENVQFDSWLTHKMKDQQFKANFELESAKLESAVALVDERERAGLTQRELADLANVPQSTIARIENGQNTSFETMSKIAAAMGKKLVVGFA